MNTFFQRLMPGRRPRPEVQISVHPLNSGDMNRLLTALRYPGPELEAGHPARGEAALDAVQRDVGPEPAQAEQGNVRNEPSIPGASFAETPPTEGDRPVVGTLFENLSWLFGEASKEWRWGQTVQVNDLVALGPVGSRRDFLIYNRSDGHVATGCFFGTLSRFRDKLHTDYPNRIGSIRNALDRYDHAPSGWVHQPIQERDRLQRELQQLTAWYRLQRELQQLTAWYEDYCVAYQFLRNLESRR